MKRAIVWFKTDLRLHDNETLVTAEIIMVNIMVLAIVQTTRCRK
jgi:deoxyribodipyrimidine photolyase